MNRALPLLWAVLLANDILACHGRVVAMVGPTRILYDTVEEPGTDAFPCPGTGKNPDPRYLRVVNERLRLEIVARVMDEGAKKAGLVISRDDVIRRHPELGDLSRFENPAMRAVARAALRVVRGDDKSRVYQEDLERYRASGVTPESFAQFVQLFNSEARIHSYLDGDNPSLKQKNAIQQIRSQMVARALADWLDKRAESEGIGRAMVRHAFWQEVMNHTAIKIVDPRFAVANIEEALP
jgi:hypothetical protein